MLIYTFLLLNYKHLPELKRLSIPSVAGTGRAGTGRAGIGRAGIGRAGIGRAGIDRTGGARRAGARQRLNRGGKERDRTREGDKEITANRSILIRMIKQRNAIFYLYACMYVCTFLRMYVFVRNIEVMHLTEHLCN